MHVYYIFESRFDMPRDGGAEEYLWSNSSILPTKCPCCGNVTRKVTGWKWRKISYDMRLIVPYQLVDPQNLISHIKDTAAKIKSNAGTIIVLWHPNQYYEHHWKNIKFHKVKEWRIGFIYSPDSYEKDYGEPIFDIINYGKISSKVPRRITIK